MLGKITVHALIAAGLIAAAAAVYAQTESDGDAPTAATAPAAAASSPTTAQDSGYLQAPAGKEGHRHHAEATAPHQIKAGRGGEDEDDDD